MKKNIIGLAVAGALSLAAFNASAEEAYQGSWYALPGISYMHADNDLDADSSGIGGFLRIGKEISEHWDVQIGLSHARADEDSNNFSNGKYKQTLFGVDALYLFSRDKFRPFLLAGLGLARNKVDYGPAPGANGSKTSWMANVGAGVQYLFTDNVGVQADVRQVWSRAEADGGLFSSSLGNKTETIGNTYLNLGVILKFGAPKKVAEVEPTPAPMPMPEPAPAPMAAPEPAPAPAPAPAPEACKPTFETITISAESLFGFDKYNLKPEGKAQLDDAATKIKAHPDAELILVTGHTDRIGTEAYNQKLSERRAETVKKYLVSVGVDAARLKAIGKGESEPVVDCKGVRGKKLIECLQPNRRVVISSEHKEEKACN